MAEMKSLNGYEIVDAKAREDIAKLQENAGSGDIYATEYWVEQNFVSGDDLNKAGFATQEWVNQNNFAPAYLAIRTLEKVTADEMATVDGRSDATMPLEGAIYHGGIYDSYALRCEFTGQGTTIKVPRIEVKTQEEYDALEIKDETVIYIIKE